MAPLTTGHVLPHENAALSIHSYTAAANSKHICSQSTFEIKCIMYGVPLMRQKEGGEGSLSVKDGVNLEKLYDACGALAFRYLLVRLGSEADAEDVLQETFCRFARYQVRWKMVRNPKMFVLRVARNEANRFLRRRIRRARGEAENPDRGRGFAAAFETPGERRGALVLRRLDELPDEQKETIHLKVFEGLTFREIAAVCGVSGNTAASRYRYGIARLRKAMEEER
jgi:RNA polymerase sigma-70 factor (ECF subfamily)